MTRWQDAPNLHPFPTIPTEERLAEMHTSNLSRNDGCFLAARRRSGETARRILDGSDLGRLAIAFLNTLEKSQTHKPWGRVGEARTLSSLERLEIVSTRRGRFMEPLQAKLRLTLWRHLLDAIGRSARDNRTPR